MKPNPLSEKTRSALRFNALVAMVLGFLAAGLLFTGKLPFPNTVAWFSLFSACSYAAYFFFFDLICRKFYRGAGVALSQMGAVVISIAVYFSGGVISPLPFLYMAILVSEAIYGMENSFTVPVSAAGYLLAVWGIYFGLFPNPTPWAGVAYSNPAFLFIVSTLLVSYLVLTKNLSEKIIHNLNSALQRESADKDALLKSFSELNATSQIGVLAHRIAHDLRGPIASISGYIQVEELRERGKEDREALATLRDVVDNMAESLNGITRFGKTSLSQAEEIDLDEFLHTLLAIIAFMPKAREVKFSRAGTGRLRVKASRADLQQAFFNLLKNAVEAVRDNPGAKTVELSVRSADGRAEVLISDNGPGMPPELLASIFKKSITTKKDGTGVGLVITRDLLARNGGDIALRNRAEGGLEAAAALPLA